MKRGAVFAGALVDGVVVAALPNKFSLGASGGWLGGILQKTWFFVVSLAVVLGLVDWGLESIVPGARSSADRLPRRPAPARMLAWFDTAGLVCQSKRYGLLAYNTGARPSYAKTWRMP